MLWIKALHIIFVITWFAGIFYLPRLFVYHAGATDQINSDRFKVMERKLYSAIMVPSAYLASLWGLWLVVLQPQFYLTQVWFYLKLVLFFCLLGYHLYCGYLIKIFARNANTHSHVFYRWFNEIPVLILIVIVILVVVKPL